MNRTHLLILAVCFLVAVPAFSENQKQYITFQNGEVVDTGTTPLAKKSDDIYIKSLGTRIQKNKGGKAPLLEMNEKCSQGAALICFYLSEYYREQNDLKKSKSFLTKSCELKDSMGCLHLGSDLLFREKNPDAAKKAFTIPCDQNEPRGCYNLGTIAEDQSRNQDALKYFEKSCKLGFEQACTNIVFLKKKMGNCAGALPTFEKWCSEGDQKACGHAQDCKKK